MGFSDNKKLFCGSRDQIYAIGPGNETAFCTISGIIVYNCQSASLVYDHALVHHTGIIYYYGYGQMTVLTFLNATFVFWGVAFPFSYRQLHESGRIRYAHIIGVLLALTLPLGELVLLKHGLSSVRNPKIYCVGRNKSLLILPIDPSYQHLYCN